MYAKANVGVYDTFVAVYFGNPHWFSFKQDYIPGDAVSLAAAMSAAAQFIANHKHFRKAA